ncbi:RES family NAD+ phosphorylase [Clostridium frigidicarnis]|uniref:RES domain-containing protein n=1 Tax=Clostridium frigidicarnis TaxID=84698 RepID=A0A1I0YD44_9CLOT|nr:RES family NAD+ phosphorylase [Clostridium frigidicarnis]SFB11254.1 RES domain-containing protein [Clostridium frigidicarnis]
MASDIDTAIAEVKPSAGHYVSLGEFEIIGELDYLHIVDFYNIDFYNFAKSDNDIGNYIFLKTLNEKLSLPNPDKKYDFTQVIADALILLRFDGIKFESSVGKGHNLVLFNYHSASYVKYSHKAVFINEVKYKVQSLNINLDINEKIEYCVKNNINEIVERHFGIRDYYKKIHEIPDFKIDRQTN